ncbi:MAG: NAD(P)/FAD-dependent oxidoreductase [Pseudomonadota bacterium]
MDRYDSIIIGAGHNGLVCAAYLATAGQRVLVLEAGKSAGGLAADREFHPGFHASVAHSVGHFSSTVAADLKLASHGYAADATMPLVGLNKNDAPVVVTDGKLEGAGDKDARAYLECNALLQRCASALRPFWQKTMPRIGAKDLGSLVTFGKLGWNLRRLGKDDMHEFMRIASLPARDLMDEYFENELVKSVLSWDGLIGSRMAPRSPNSAILAMLYRLSEGSLHAHSIPTGGAAGLATALLGAAEAAGVEVRLGTAVDKVQIEGSETGLCAAGVTLADGSTIAADRVISSADPQTTFFKLVGVQHLEIGFTNQVQRLRCNGYVAKLHLALDGLPEFSGVDQPDGRMIIAPTMDSIEFAFDDSKYGEASREPVLEVVMPSVHDNELAPDGKHVLSAHVMYVPRELKGGCTDAARNQVRERAIDTIADYAPGIRSLILHSELLTPADLERQYRVTGGHWHHTEFAMDQLLMMRPTYGAAQYGSPIPGLHLCGAGSHPGGDLVGAAGHNAAHEVLK